MIWFNLVAEGREELGQKLLGRSAEWIEVGVRG